MKQIGKVLAAVLALCLAGCSVRVEKPETATTAPADSNHISTEAPETTEPRQTAPELVPTQTTPRETAPIEPSEDEFVRVTDYIPDLVVELRYATENNFTGRKIYDFTEAWLRYGTVRKLMQAQAQLKQKGLSLKIWDAFRPTSAQFLLWDACPDPTYVANPVNGFSSHSRGNTVDVTIVDAGGREQNMPTDFDDFSELADRDYSDCDGEAAANALMLEQIMTECGFKPYKGEWWHFSDIQTYPVEETFDPAA